LARLRWAGLRLAALAAALATSGCLAGWRLGAGLTLDTTLQVGAQSYVGADFGVGDDDAGGPAVSVEGGGGLAVNPLEGRIFAGPGIDYQRPGEHLCWRAGLRGLFEGSAPAAGEGRFHLGPGVAVAVMKTVDDEHDRGHEKWGGDWDSYLGVGGELRATALTVGSEPTRAVEDRPRLWGQFALGIVLERMVYSGF
jgi:hypothetical protein